MGDTGSGACTQVTDVEKTAILVGSTISYTVNVSLGADPSRVTP